MTMESLFDEEWPLMLLREAKPGEVDANGLPLHRLVEVREVIGRIRSGSARQQAAWMSQGIEADATLVTFDPNIENGQFLRDHWDKLYRLVSTNDDVIGKGTVDTIWRYALKFESRT